MPFFRADEAAAPQFLQQTESAVVRGRRTLAAGVRRDNRTGGAKRRGERIPFLTGLGSTETAPIALGRMWEQRASTSIWACPRRASTLKLVPTDGKLEARLRGPNITPGYWRQPELTAKAFDEEGFYKLGDALKFEDPKQPAQRIAVRRPPHRGFQALDRHLGQRRPAAHADHNRLPALCARRGARRRDRNDVTALVVPDMEAIRALRPICRRLSAAAVCSIIRASKDKVQRIAASFRESSTG